MSVEDMKKYKTLIESVLEEAQNYDDMFKELIALHASDMDDTRYIRDNVAEIISRAKGHLRKKDRIIWFLRQWRIGYLQDVISLIEDNPYGGPDTELVTSFLPKAKLLMDRYAAEFSSKTNSKINYSKTSYVYSRNSKILTDLEHYFSLPIQKIQDFVFAYQYAYDVLEYFKQLEREWASTRDQLIPFDPDDGKVILSFDDGFFWQNLNRAYCNKEGQAMGHCGNAASYRTGDLVLSLRKKVKVGKEVMVRPSLTFILHEDGMLGEMKGRANNKPDAKYHPYIVALLKSPIVKGIVGGGYAAQNNFALSDLDNSTISELLDQKPQLINNNEFARMLQNGIEISQNIQIAVAKQFSDMISYLLMHDITPSEAVQMAAIERNPYSIKYLVKAGIVPSEAVQLAAVSQDGESIYHVVMSGIKPSEAVQIAAVKNYNDAINYIRKAGIEPSAKVRAAAGEKNVS